MSYIWFIATFLAFYVKGLCGFANTLIFQTVMGYGVDNVNISPVELILTYPANILMAYRERRSINWKFAIPIAALLVVGLVPGVLILANADPRPIKILCGIIVVLSGIEMLFRGTGTNHAGTRRGGRAGSGRSGSRRGGSGRKGTGRGGSKLTLVVVGLVTGVLSGIFGIGIVLAAYMTRISDNTSEFKANMGCIFSIENTFRIVAYVVLGVITWETVKQTVLLIPVMLVAMELGMFSAKKLNEKVCKKIVIIMLIISGAALVLTNLH